MKLIDATNKILMKINGSEVDSIEDTEESLSVANELIDEYLKLHSQSRDAWVNKKFSMENESKYEMKAPSNVQNINYIKYNGMKLEFISTSDFEDLLLRNKNKDGHNAEGYGVAKDPKYFTSYDQVTIEVDGINEDVEAAVDGINTICYGKVRPSPELLDDYEFNPLPPSYFDVLLNDATASCLNRFREKSAQYDREMAAKTKVKLNRHNKFDYSSSYLGEDDDDQWGF